MASWSACQGLLAAIHRSLAGPRPARVLAPEFRFWGRSGFRAPGSLRDQAAWLRRTTGFVDRAVRLLPAEVADAEIPFGVALAGIRGRARSRRRGRGG